MTFRGIDKNKILKAISSLLPKDEAVLEIGLVFVSPKKMRELNKKYRSQNKVTNILSFALGDPALERDRLSRMQFTSFKGGDIVICPEVVKKEAKAYGFTQKNWMTRLVVHGILHLIGYNHARVKDRKEMEGLEEIVLGKLNIKNV